MFCTIIDKWLRTTQKLVLTLEEGRKLLNTLRTIGYHFEVPLIDLSPNPMTNINQWTRFLAFFIDKKWNNVDKWNFKVVQSTRVNSDFLIMILSLIVIVSGEDTLVTDRRTEFKRFVDGQTQRFVLTPITDGQMQYLSRLEVLVAVFRRMILQSAHLERAKMKLSMYVWSILTDYFFCGRKKLVIVDTVVLFAWQRHGSKSSWCWCKMFSSWSRRQVFFAGAADVANAYSTVCTVLYAKGVQQWVVGNALKWHRQTCVSLSVWNLLVILSLIVVEIARDTQSLLTRVDCTVWCFFK